MDPFRIFPVGDRLYITDAAGTYARNVAAKDVTLGYDAAGVTINGAGLSGTIPYANFLSQTGSPWGGNLASAKAAFDSALQSAPNVTTTPAPIRYDDKELHRLIAAPMINTSKSTGGINVPRTQVTSANTLNLSFTVEPGKTFHLTNVLITCDRPYWIGVTVRKQGSTNFNNQSDAPYFILGDKDTRIDLTYNDLLYEGGVVAVTGAPISGTASQDQAYMTMHLTGRARSLYEVDNADYRIVVLADSKALYTLPNGDFGERYYPNQLARALQSLGKRVSIIDKTMPGASSSDMLRMIKSGALDGIKYDLLVVAYGTNNANTAATGSALTQFKTDLSEAILHRNRTNPGASILFNTPGVTDKTSLLPNIDAYRTAVGEVANDATLGGTARRVYLCQEHLAFTVSGTVKSDRFIATEALNSQLHYSMLGHDDVFVNRFYPAIKTTDFWQNTLKLNP